jgi:predicted dehydrogenase
MEKVRIGIVGVGWIAQVVHLPMLQKIPDGVIAAICDRDRARVRLVGEKFGIAKQYTDVEAMLAGEEIDAVIVCTSTDAHRDVAVTALKAGKDVLVEKPIANRFAEAAEIAAVSKETKKKVMVGMNHRFRPDTIILKSMIEGKELGKILYTRVGWLRRANRDLGWLKQKEKAGRGVVIDQGIVMLDLALWLMGYPEVKRVQAAAYNNKTRHVEDTALVSMVLKNGSTVGIEVGWSTPADEDIYYCQIHGTDGSASMNPLRVTKELHGSLVNLAPAKIDPPQHLFRRSYENELKHFIQAVQGLHPVVSTAEEAVQRMKIIEAVYAAIRKGKEISLTA